jgi:WS/DGAT/MGAT family acyltransferase
MKQLSGTDGQFFGIETANTAQHIAILSIYDPSTAPGKFVRFKDILRTFESRLDMSPVFRSRIVDVPLNLDQPYWIDDPDFSLEYHVRHIALPKPGDWRQLCIQVARLHSRPLDKSRPLWEAYVIEGLDNIESVPEGAFALYLKVHHAAVDGMAGERLFAALHDLKPVVAAHDYGDSGQEWRPKAAPGNAELLGRAYLNFLSRPAKFLQLGRDALPAWMRKREYLQTHPDTKATTRPATRFNGLISPHRVFNATSISLKDIRLIRQLVPGCTVNDVAAALISLALRNYLKHRDELPDSSLRTWIPISLRDSTAASEQGGNAISLATVDLATQFADPIEILSSIHRETAETKAYREAVGADMLVEMSETMPAALQMMAGRVVSLAARFGGNAIPANVSISNVPGPQIPLYMAGTRLVNSYGVGVLQEGMGLFHAVTSYDGMLNISFTACRDQLPDPEDYLACLEDSLAQFRRATKKSRPARKARPKQKRVRK